MSVESVSEGEQVVLERIEPLLHELWRPLRFLADLKAVWPELSVQQRSDIEGSRVYRQRYHERLAESRSEELKSLLRRIRAPELRDLRDQIEAFIDRRGVMEPDQARVLAALVKKNYAARQS